MNAYTLVIEILSALCVIGFVIFLYLRSFREQAELRESLEMLEERDNMLIAQAAEIEALKTEFSKRFKNNPLK